MKPTPLASLIAALLLSAPACSSAVPPITDQVDASAQVDSPPDQQTPPSTLSEVVVTARKKSEPLQEVPMSVAAFDAEQLDELGIYRLEDLATYVPGLQQQDLAISSRLTLRGVNSGDNNAFEQSVGTYVDGIYRGRMNQQHIGFYDVERIEVLKGPQVTLYGNSSLGGAISVITKKPQFEFGGDVSVRYGLKYQEPRVDAAVDIPISEQLALRVAGTWRDQGVGISPNDATGETEPTSEDRAIRLSALWLPTDELTVSMRHEQGRFERNGNIFDIYKHVDGRGNPWPNSSFVGLDDGRLNIGNGAPFKYQDSFLHTDMQETLADIQYAFDTVTVTSITGYSSYDYQQSADVDITPATLINVYQDEDYRQFSQELRIAGRWSDNADYLAGVYFQRDNFGNDYFADFNLPALLAPAFGIPTGLAAQLISPFARHILIDQETEQRALFGNVHFDLSDKLTATLGYRYLMIDKHAQQAVRVADGSHRDGLGAPVDIRWLNPSLAPLLLGNSDYLANPSSYVLVLADGTRVAPVLLPQHAVGYNIVSLGAGKLHEFDNLSRDEQHPMYQLSLAYQWTPDLMLYSNWANGAKAGGFDFLYEGDQRNEVEYGDESASVFELGFKKDWQQVRLNAAVFYGKYEDLQVSVFDGGIGFVVGNAASSISQGIDIDLDWNISEDLSLLARAEYLDFSYDDFPDANCSTTERLNTGATLCDLSGERAPFVPKFEGVFGVQHAFETAANWRVQQLLNWSYRGSHFTASDNEIQTRQSAYGLLDYRLELSPADSNWSLAILGKNLADKQYNVFTSVIPLAPGGAFASVRAKGREVALEWRWRF